MKQATFFHYSSNRKIDIVVLTEIDNKVYLGNKIFENHTFESAKIQLIRLLWKETIEENDIYAIY